MRDLEELRLLYRRLKSAGVEVGPGIRRHAEHAFFVSDPEGNAIDFSADRHPGRDRTGESYAPDREQFDLNAPGAHLAVQRLGRPFVRR
jgi:catechol-2,3-dioxygenase